MAAPKYEFAQKSYQNPHSSLPLIIPYIVLCNTSDEVLAANVKRNSALELEWLRAEKPHGKIAVMIGGGPSVNGLVEQIKELKAAGAVVFAMNAASKWARGQGIEVDYQVLSDAKAETSTLVDSGARHHLIASQVNPLTIDAAMFGKKLPTLWHLETGDVEQHFPPERRKRGGYALIGGGAATGNCAMCVAYAMGFRDFHVFGYDSSHWQGYSHAYSQPMNDLIPTVDVEWAGKKYTCSVAMKAQAEKFQITSQALKQEGCKIEVYGDGLLQHMFRTPPNLLTERDKYRTIWQFDGYRNIAPGEFAAPLAAKFMEQPGPVIDFGCGTGRGSVVLSQLGFDVVLVDFADNCRDHEAMVFPFLEWDLSLPCPLRAPYGICCDVMEHIPTNQVGTVIENIVASAKQVFFQISTVPDTMGASIGETLHLTVKPHGWWLEHFEKLGLELVYQERSDIASVFVVRKQEI